MTDLVSGVAVGSSGQEKISKVGRVVWMGALNQALSEGLAASQWLANMQTDKIGAGRQICLDLWPFIVELPDNIKAVMTKLPPSLEPAKLFLNNLADEERGFQELYIKQCALAGLSREDLMTSRSKPSPATAGMVEAMKKACIEGDVLSGCQAIVAAELAATQFARQVKDVFEVYFDQHRDQYQSEIIEEGLAWVRLHAKPNTRHAIWMNRMLAGLGGASESAELPDAVRLILSAVFAFWHVEKSTADLWLRSKNQSLN